MGSEERLRWEGERDRLLARIKELQVRNRSDNQGVFYNESCRPRRIRSTIR